MNTRNIWFLPVLSSFILVYATSAEVDGLLSVNQNNSSALSADSKTLSKSSRFATQATLQKTFGWTHTGTHGTAFVFSVIQHEEMISRRDDITLCFAGQYPMQVMIKSAYKTSLERITREQNCLDLDKKFFGPNETYLDQSGIYVESTSNISFQLYVVDRGDGSADGFMVIPMTLLSTKYFLECFVDHGDGFCEMDVTTMYDNTALAITIRSDHAIIYKGNSYPNGSTLFVNLNRFANFNLRHEYSLTGTVVRSSCNKPVAVISGGMQSKKFFNTSESNKQKTGYYKFIMEQMVPVEYWGNRHIIPKPFNNSRYTIQVISAFENTSVVVENYNPNKPYRKNMNEGDHFHLEVGNYESIYIRSSRPIQVVQYGSGNRYPNGNEDRFMMQVPPIAQFDDTYIFTLPEYSQNYVLIIAESTTGCDIHLDGKAIEPLYSEKTKLHDLNINYTVMTISVGSGLHVLNHSLGRKVFGAMYVGCDANLSSTGYPLGMRLQNLSQEECWTPMSINKPSETQEKGLAQRVLEKEIIVLPSALAIILIVYIAWCARNKKQANGQCQGQNRHHELEESDNFASDYKSVTGQNRHHELEESDNFASDYKSVTEEDASASG